MKLRLITEDGEVLVETMYADVAESCAWALCKFNSYPVTIQRASEKNDPLQWDDWKRYYLGKTETDKVMYEYPGQMLYRDTPSATATGS